jgi:hypothetical protein
VKARHAYLVMGTMAICLSTGAGCPPFSGDDLITITTSASPSEGGTVTGGGEYASGESVTVTAATNSGYTFVNWTEDGVEVSDSASYTFTVIENCNLVANFLSSTLKVTLYNDSCGTYIAAKFGVCPKGMSEQPHYFIDPPAVIAPGDSITYTTDQVVTDEGGSADDGNCVAFPTAFTVGVPGWGYGPTNNPDTMTWVGMPADPPYVGFIDTQFHCGDTINLRWSNCDTGTGAGTWTSEVIPGPGNPAPTAPFGPPPS